MRKLVFRRLLALLLAVCALRAVAFAETALVTGSGVNVRAGPGMEYEIMGSFTRGSSVEVLSRANPDWYAVSFYGQTGYMSSRYLSIQADGGSIVYDGASFSLPQQSGTYSPAPTALPSSSQGGSALIISDWDKVGLIVAPTPEATPTPAIVFTSPSPTPLPVEPSPLPTVMPSSALLVTPTPVPEAEPTPTSVPTAEPTPTSAPAAAETRGGSIAGDYVRFRKGPGTQYSILDTYDRGKALTILGTEGDWTRCVIDGQTGYVYSQYVQLDTAAQSGTGQLILENGSAPASPAPSVSDGGSASPEVSNSVAEQPAVQSSDPTSAYIKGNNVRFRSGPGLSYSIYTELFFGNEVTVTGVSGDWTAVVYQGQAGFVYSQYVAQGSVQKVSTGGSATGREIADYALSFVGYSYVWGGKSPSTGFDCSGLVYYVFSHFGYTVNRVAADQARNGRHIEASELEPGDLLCFYSGGSYIGHTGIYIGNNQFVHASSSTTGVIISELAGYYATRGFECRRII